MGESRTDWPGPKPEEVAFDARVGLLLEPLDVAGWVYEGGFSIETETIGYSFSLSAGDRGFKMTDALTQLPITGEDGGVLAGVEVDIRQDGQAVIDYDGPIDDTLEQIVAAMAAVSDPDVVDKAITRETLPDSVLRAQVHITAGDLLVGELPDDVRSFIARVLDTPAPTPSVGRTIGIYRGESGKLRSRTSLIGTGLAHSGTVTRTF